MIKKIVLMGNPNVGKSVVFSRLTGANVISSNYPGTTVDFSKGKMRIDGKTVEIIDAPGTYSLEPTNNAEKVATAASEMIENAYKYSPEESDFNINIQEKKDTLTFQVRNYPIDDPQETYEIICSEIKKIYSNPDPNEAFKDKMMESLSDPSGKSMLGFAKIRLETGATLNVELDPVGLIITTADFPLK